MTTTMTINNVEIEYRDLDIIPDAETTEPISCEAILEEWTERQLEIVAGEKGINVNFSSKQLREADWKALAVEAISQYIRENGIRLLIQEFDMVALKQMTKNMDESFLTKNGNTKTKTVLAKRLTEAVIETGALVLFMTNTFKQKNELVQRFVGLLNFLGATTKAKSRTTLAVLLAEELDTFYMRAFLQGIPASFLRSICDEIKIFHGDCSSSLILTECIISGTWYEPKEVTYLKPNYKKKPKSISQKCNKADLTSWFLANELREFCEANELRTSGKKVELADRIIGFFDPEKENETKLPVGRKGRKKRDSRVEGTIVESKKRTSKAPRRKSSQALEFSSSEDSESF